MKRKKDLYTLPNFLSFYRILAFPFILYLAISGREYWFAVFLIINLITDVLDGAIARGFHQQTEIGARLDSIADFGTYILAVTGIFMFKMEEFSPYLYSFYVFVFFIFAPDFFSLLKFKCMPSLHLYSWKIGGYIQGIFFFTLFTLGFYPALYYFMIVWGVIASIEHILIQIIINEMKSNAKGLYWVLKNKNAV
jgi:CDP-diacylglycerol--glycerol-3-phosphate 3-phosphatidyltransferase